MSAKQRAEASKLRERYARVFTVPLADVEIVYLPDDDAVVRAPGLPEWSLGAKAEGR